MINRLPDHRWNMCPLNAWPWRDWQVCRGNRGQKEE